MRRAYRDRDREFLDDPELEDALLEQQGTCDESHTALPSDDAGDVDDDGPCAHCRHGNDVVRCEECELEELESAELDDEVYGQ